MLIALAILAFFGLVLFIVRDMLVAGNPNTFFDSWTKRTLWLWLPFYALKRLIKEIFFDK